MTDLRAAPPPPAAAAPAGPPPRSLSLGMVVAIALIALLIAAAWFWSNLLLIAFAAILIAIALRAGARGLNRLVGLSIKLGVLVVLLGVVAAIALMVRLAGPAVSDQFGQLISSLPESWGAVEGWFASLPFGEQMIEQVQDSETADIEDNATRLAERLPDIFGMVLGGISSVFGGLTSMFLLLILSIYIAMEADLYRGGLIRLVPLPRRGRAAQILDELGTQLALWMGGQALDMLIVAILAGIGLWMLEVPLALILAVIAGLTNVVPIIGPFLSGAIAVVVAAPQGLQTALYVAILFTVIQVFEGEVLMPMIQKYAVQLPPALTILAIVAMGALFGPASVILATPLLIVVIHLTRRIYVEDVLGDRLD
ncbi:AI-2E family transporter [Paracoccus gahaiensis]|uniref:AI-2E family transporter n=1 Tax=Paracoccus gahaiensis TaxID=1706839 RepID=A0A4U0RFP3_9RHOB|nr:AI-2E family transporter [Paracoccus gahaiensis]TJZ93440.1 AI-2E family transporter [Paracoccus gahaiensis]